MAVLMDVHAALPTELPIQALMETVEKDVDGFQASALSEIEQERGCLSPGDAERIVGLAGLVAALPDTVTDPWPESVTKVTMSLGLSPCPELKTWNASEPPAAQIERILFG